MSRGCADDVTGPGIHNGDHPMIHYKIEVLINRKCILFNSIDILI